jgi:integrating conjugative element protein (TIGR03765 family)
MFIVGDDAMSRQWLATNRQRLTRIGATGVVANVLSIESLQALRSAAPGLPMAPATLDSVAQDLSLTVYPVLIGTDGQVTQEVR